MINDLVGPLHPKDQAPYDLVRSAMDLTAAQLRTLTTVERVASTLSILGVITIIGTFAHSRHFRNPMHRLIFINAFYNLFDFIATMIATSGPAAGNHSRLCQFQGFCLQMYVSLSYSAIRWIADGQRTALTF